MLNSVTENPYNESASRTIQHFLGNGKDVCQNKWESVCPYVIYTLTSQQCIFSIVSNDDVCLRILEVSKSLQIRVRKIRYLGIKKHMFNSTKPCLFILVLVRFRFLSGHLLGKSCSLD